VLIVDGLCCLRLVKVLPLLKMFDILKSKDLQKWRIIEVIVLYYIICHVISNVWISMGLSHSDIRSTWLRRLPVPRSTGMRPENNLDGLSNVSIYIHALFFVVNTVSHVAVGDITAVTYNERVFVAVLILCGTFIYVFLFGNIVSIVQELGNNERINYFDKYQFVMRKLETMKLDQQIKTSIDEYFNYTWGNDLEPYEQALMTDLPPCMRSDLLLCKYQEAIEGSLIFKDDTGAIDVSLTNSIIS
jgi:hypothetical protein